MTENCSFCYYRIMHSTHIILKALFFALFSYFEKALIFAEIRETNLKRWQFLSKYDFSIS